MALEVTNPYERIWKPHAKQAEFIQLPHTFFEGFFGGAAGPGKTDALMMIPIVWGWFRHPHFKGLILRRTFQDLEKELISRTHEYYPLSGGRYNEQKRRWKWPSGAMIQFGHCENEKDKKNYDSAEYNYIAFDELTHFTESQYTYIAFTRARSSDPDLPSIVRSASNPGGIGHSWVRKRFIESCKEGRQVLKETVTDITGREVVNKRIFIPAYATDNPTLLENDPNYLARMEMLPEAERRAKVYGDWWLFQGQVFTEFRNERLIGEPENASHVIPPFSIPEWYPRIFHLDWGTEAASAGYWGAITPDKRIIIYREYYEKGKKVSDWGNDFKELSYGEDVRRVGLCHSAFADRGGEFSLAQQFAHYSGITPESSGRDRIGGRYLLHDFLRWRPLEKSPLSKGTFDTDIYEKVFRLEGETRANQYKKQFEVPEVEKNLPRLLIFESCPELIRTIPLCIYDEKNTDDVAQFVGDDPYDSLRGLLRLADRYINEAKDEADKREVVNGILQQLTDSGDQTMFYNRMRYLEAGQHQNYGVRRHGSTRSTGMSGVRNKRTSFTTRAR